MIVAFKSDRGNERKTNQDVLMYSLNKNKQYIYILCDGMGGYKGGEVAASECANYIKDKFESTNFKTSQEAKDWLYTTITEVNKFIRDTATTSNGFEKMGTTLVCLIVSSQFKVFANVGDSRIYSYNKRELKQLSDDQTFTNALLKAGYINEKEAAMHPKRGLLVSAIGSSDEDLDIQIEEIIDDSNYLLCSDGLYNAISNKEILKIINNEKEINSRAEELINQANSNGGNDNVSVILVEDSL